MSNEKKLLKMIKTRDIVIRQLKEEIAGHHEVGQILSAYITALIKGRPDSKAMIRKEDIKDMMGQCWISVAESEDKEYYILEFKNLSDMGTTPTEE